MLDAELLGRITAQSVRAPSDLIDLEDELAGVFYPGELTSVTWAFRGQSQAFGTLVPSFRREFAATQSRLTVQHIERKLIDAFRKHYDTLDRPAEMPSPADISPDKDLTCLSVMQHYGIPTRLLDWTSSFLGRGVFRVCQCTRQRR